MELGNTSLEVGRWELVFRTRFWGMGVGCWELIFQEWSLEGDLWELIFGSWFLAVDLWKYVSERLGLKVASRSESAEVTGYKLHGMKIYHSHYVS